MLIVVTRPLTQASVLKSLVKKNCHQVVLFPSMYIKPLNQVKLTKKYKAIIFISVNAVNYGIKTLLKLKNHNYKLFAIGSATANMLAHYNLKVDAFPQKEATSSTLLKISKLSNIKNSNILIFRGLRGSETLKQELIKKGNSVDYANVYERIVSNVEPVHQRSLNKILSSKNTIITISSVESLQAVINIIKQINIDAIPIIKNYHLVVLSQRIALYAQSIGFKKIKIATQTNDYGLMEAIKLI